MSVKIVETYNYWSRIPFIGHWLMAWIMSFVSPYTGSLPLRIIHLTDNECETFMYEAWYLKNPFNSIHAAALTNFGEATMGLAMLAYGQSHDMKAIPTRLEIDFIKKARGNLKAYCTLPAIDPNASKVTIETIIKNQQGELVAKVAGVWTVSPLRQKLE